MNPIAQTHTIEYVLDALPTLRLTNHKGDLRVIHDADPGVVNLRLCSARPVSFDGVMASSDGTTVTVTIPQLRESDSGVGLSIRLPGLSFFAGLRGATVDVEVHLPSGSRTTLETGYGNIAVSGISGETSAKTGAGDITIAEAGRVVANSGVGSVSVGQINGGTIRTGTGDLRIDKSVGDTQLHSGTGDVLVLDAAGSLKINTGAGDVHARISEGSIEVRSGMGDINMQVPAGISVWQDLTTGIGEVRSLVASLGEPEPGEPFLKVTAHSGAGDITLAN